MAYEFTFALKTGHDTSTYYGQIIRTSDGYLWDGVAGALAAAPTYGNTALTVTEHAGTGIMGVALPSAMPAGFYRMLLRAQAGAAPAATDNIVDSQSFQVAGGRISG
jgi:hypothetical protein